MLMIIYLIELSFIMIIMIIDVLLLIRIDMKMITLILYFCVPILNSPQNSTKASESDQKCYVKSVLPSKYLQSVTIQHWQLRDLVQAPRSSKEFFTVFQNGVRRYSTNTGEIQTIFKDLNFVPTSIAVNHGFVAAGGQQGQLVIRELDGPYLVQANVGGSINNALSISALGGPDQLRLFVCNNDETIKIYSLPELILLRTLSLPTACNHAAISPDGRNLVAVGDSNEVFLFDIRGQTFTLTHTFRSTNDAGFSCSWNRFGNGFAVASQDGYVSIFDLRKNQKLISLASKQQAPLKGACRCVKFSPTGPIDLLMFSEHVNYVHVVDARTFLDRQILRVSPLGIDQHVAGVTFTPESKSLLIGTDTAVYEYEIDTLSQRSFYHGDLL